MLTDYLHYNIKILTVRKVEVNRADTPLKTVENKAIRVFE